MHALERDQQQPHSPAVLWIFSGDKSNAWRHVAFIINSKWQQQYN